MSIVDPRDVTDVQIGTRLRDAAVDPRPDDFLPPTNAGEPGELGNPHGPTVVSPEIHASQGVRPVRPGEVSPVAATQSAQETAHAQAWQDTTGTTTVTPATASVAVGATRALAAAGVPDSTVTSWASSSVAVATVNGSGVVTGVAAGTATITATLSDGSTASATVTVTGA
ncbi:Ig-like domain-containing protein [Cellulosimicrobium funkei]|uniref:Ig-like domain-containing protein n=1 Tax=Cellulosimicrobium funkei TaxID=264251 RepID=UPI00341B3D23